MQIFTQKLNSGRTKRCFKPESDEDELFLHWATEYIHKKHKIDQILGPDTGFIPDNKINTENEHNTD
jgi:hypothetical protein